VPRQILRADTVATTRGSAVIALELGRDAEQFPVKDGKYALSETQLRKTTPAQNA
jgi:hypothetical protein